MLEKYGGHLDGYSAKCAEDNRESWWTGVKGRRRCVRVFKNFMFRQLNLSGWRGKSGDGGAFPAAYSVRLQVKWGGGARAEPDTCRIVL